MKTWIIINESNYAQEKENGFILPNRKRPRKVFIDKKIALDNLMRIKIKYPYMKLVLYESIVEYKKDDNCMYEVK